jgi:hypothetical protein
MSSSHIEWDRSTVGWRHEGAVLYVEHRLEDRPLTVFVPALQEWLGAQGWAVEVVSSTGYRVDVSDAGTRITFGSFELCGPRLMQAVDPELLRDNVNRLAADAVVTVQRQIDQDEKHREDFLAALRRRPS